MKALVAGWFSFEQMGATAGDLLARDVVCRWLSDSGMSYDVATAPPFEGGVDWQAVDPEEYSHVIFVCGPFGNGWPLTEFLPRFSGSRLVGIDLSMLEPLEIWNPFDVLLERDSSRTSRPDLAFLSEREAVPVVGVVLTHPQKEYEEGAHERVNEQIDRVLVKRDVTVVRIDTRLDKNAVGLRTPPQVESLIARMDAVVTTRLHGLVLALKNGVPVVAVDPILGGAKVVRQGEVLGWPYVFAADGLEDRDLADALDACLDGSATAKVAEVVARACAMLEADHQTFIAAMSEDP